MGNKPLVSVCLITYNQAAYIKEAVDSVLRQQTNFCWELVIADDFSKDGTREIILEYQDANPDKVKLILQDENVGAYRNWMDLIQYPQSKYIAYLEGDDYWTDAQKLQKQIDFLEKNTDVSLCGHNVNVLLPDKSLHASERNADNLTRFSLPDIGRGTLLHSCTIVHRNIISTYPEWFARLPLGDWPFMVLLMMSGDLVILPETMAVYRKNAGVWSSASRLRQITGIIETINVMLTAPEFAHFPAFRKNLISTKIKYLRELHASSEAGNYPGAVNEINIIDYYDEIVSNLQSAFKDKKELTARAPFGTLIKALFTKFNRKIKI